MKYGLTFDRPLMNAAGSLGFSPARRSEVYLEQFGAFVTSPISLTRRTPAGGTRCISFAGGFLLHTGLPNPGLKAVLKRHAQRWVRQPLPVWVHLLASHAAELAQMVSLLEGMEGVAGLEVGLDADADRVTAQALTKAASGELPVIVRLPLERSLELGEAVLESGASALSLGPPRGMLPDAGGGMVSGRLYGPAIFPLALNAIHRLAMAGLPVIAGGGAYSTQDAEAMLAAGAVAVQLDSILWRGWRE